MSKEKKMFAEMPRCSFISPFEIRNRIAISMLINFGFCESFSVCEHAKKNWEPKGEIQYEKKRIQYTVFTLIIQTNAQNKVSSLEK